MGRHGGAVAEATQPRSSAPRVGCDPIPYLGCFLREAPGQRDPDAGILEPCKAAALDKRPAVRPALRAPEQRQCPSGLPPAASPPVPLDDVPPRPPTPAPPPAAQPRPPPRTPPPPPPPPQ